MNRQRRGQRGFTLVEMLVATTVTVLVASSTTIILRNAAAVRSRADRQMTAQMQARAAVGAIATAVANVSRFPKGQWRMEGIVDTISDAPADRIRLETVSRRPIRLGQSESDAREMEFYLVQEPDQPGLMLMRRTDPTRNAEPDGGGVLECVARNVAALDIDWYDGAQWLDQWPGETVQQTAAQAIRLPQAVRIRLGVLTEGRPPIAVGAMRVVNFPYLPAELMTRDEGGSP